MEVDGKCLSFRAKLKRRVTKSPDPDVTHINTLKTMPLYTFFVYLIEILIVMRGIVV